MGIYSNYITESTLPINEGLFKKSPEEKERKGFIKSVAKIVQSVVLNNGVSDVYFDTYGNSKYINGKQNFFELSMRFGSKAASYFNSIAYGDPADSLSTKQKNEIIKVVNDCKSEIASTIKEETDKDVSIMISSSFSKGTSIKVTVK